MTGSPTIPHALIECLRSARAVTMLTGAGISAESGIPTFRDAMKGHWAKFDPMELATPEGFAQDPERVSRWYDERRVECGAVEPNAGHVALVHMEEALTRRGGSLTLLTQNVDRLHQRAGSRRVVELHGNLWVWRCLECGREQEETGPAFPQFPPRCTCGGVRRPGVVWFGEMLPPAALNAAQEALVTCDLFFSIGTSALVEPAAGFVHTAREAGAATCEVNPEATPISDVVDWSLRGAAGDLLPQLMENWGSNQTDRI